MIVDNESFVAVIDPSLILVLPSNPVVELVEVSTFAFVIDPSTIFPLETLLVTNIALEFTLKTPEPLTDNPLPT